MLTGLLNDFRVPGEAFMALDGKDDRILARKETEDLLRERSVTLIADSRILRQYSSELIQASRLLRLRWRQD